MAVGARSKVAIGSFAVTPYTSALQRTLRCGVLLLSVLPTIAQQRIAVDDAALPALARRHS
jgi:hypothetical protein